MCRYLEVHVLALPVCRGICREYTDLSYRLNRALVSDLQKPFKLTKDVCFLRVPGVRARELRT